MKEGGRGRAREGRQAKGLAAGAVPHSGHGDTVSGKAGVHGRR